jgi:hypothetical protein
MTMPDSTHSAATPSSSAPRFDVPALKRAFDDDGYFVLRGAVSQDELKSVETRMFDAFDDWKRSTAKFEGGGMVSGHLNCYPGSVARGVLSDLASTGTLDMLQSIYPTDTQAIRLGCNFNLPGSVEQHYHIDGIFLDNYLIVNVAVVDTDLVNGAIDIIPKTHKRFYKYWEFAAQRVSRGSTRIQMSRGDVLVRQATLWHRGMPNKSQKARPMLAITLGEKGVNNPDPFAYAGGNIEFQKNWFSSSLLGRVRERTTVMAPITYSAYRFARSLVGNKGYASF